MKQILFICWFIILGIGSSTAQYIDNIGGGSETDINLIYIDPNCKVQVITMDMFSLKSFDTITYRFSGNKVFSKAPRYFGDSYLRCYLYPRYVATKNNNFQISSSEKDSLTYNARGQLIRVSGIPPGGDHEGDFVYEYYYLNDTTIMEVCNNRASAVSEIYLYKLSLVGNIKEVRYGTTNKNFQVSLDSIDKVGFSERTVFAYNKHKALITSVVKYSIEENKERLLSRQDFFYEKNKPVKCIIKDCLSGKIIQTRKYIYSPCGSVGNVSK